LGCAVRTAALVIQIGVIKAFDANKFHVIHL